MKYKIIPYTFLNVFFFTSFIANSQQSDVTSDTLKQKQYDTILEMSLEDLLNVTIVSASRKEENSFDAPLSSWVITKQEIINMGATSIPDALRYCPGLIVREISNGTYDVSIRGGIDGNPGYGYTYINSSILVMIDNRPVFSYLQGGTYWQNLPIGLAEIERIEIVNGPASPLFGPNAVSGVINIISNRTNDEVTSFINSVAMGGKNTNIISTQVGVRLNSKFSTDVSLNYEYRTRFDEDFYNSKKGIYTPIDSISSLNTTKDARFPEISRSLNRMGGTINLNYKESEKMSFDLSGSINQNSGLMPLVTGVPLSTFTNISQNVYLKGVVHGLGIQASYLSGRQGLTGNIKENNYDYSNTDLYIDYDFKFVKDKISLKPALSYQRSYANDLPYTVNVKKSGTFNSEGSLQDIAGSLKIEAKPIEKLRIIAAGRYDKFNYPDKGVFSYQGIVNYSLNSKNISRFIASKSYNSSFLVPTLINSSNPINPTMNVVLAGNKNLNLLSNNMLEIGHRIKIANNVIVDLAAFNQTFTNLNVLIFKGVTVTNPPNMSFNYFTENLPLKIVQNGLTVSAQSTFKDNKFQFKPSITIQNTRLKNYSPWYNEKGAYDTRFPVPYKFAPSKDSLVDVDSKSTPSLWFGFNVVVKPIEKLTIDVSGVYYDKYQLHMSSEINNQTGVITNQNGSNINSKIILNINLNYKLHKNLSAYLNVRNLLKQQSAEGFGSDRIGRSILLGLNLMY